MTHYVETDGALVYKEEELNFKKWVVRMLKAWPWFLLCIIVCVGCAFLYVRYANPVYQVRPTAGSNPFCQTRSK